MAGKTDLNVSRLRQLLSECFNESLDPQGKAELDDLLNSSPAARDMYWQYVEVHAGLNFKFRGLKFHAKADDWNAATIPAHIGMDQSNSGGIQNRVRAGMPSWAPYGMAAAVLLIALGTIFTSASFFQQHREEVNAPQFVDQTHGSLESQPRESVLGTLRPLVEASHWSFGKPGEPSRTSFLAGDTLWLDSGAVELVLTNKTTAKLEAPAIIQMLSLERARVLKGRITVDVAKGAEGFTVETTSAEVVDLGTVFSVDVDDVATDVIVFEGKVDLKYSKQPGNVVPPEQPTLEVRRMNMGEAIRVQNDGTLSRIVHVLQTDFRKQRTPVISAVRDNIHREGMSYFYEIVPGGMNEDAPAFADRLHQWNGVDVNGMPDYLLGGDYVKTFNDDKVVDELEITLTIERPSLVYILIDTRTPPPPWLTAAFEDTGGVVGVDQKSDAPAEGSELSKYHLANGAGKSVDFIHSIWRREVREPGEIVLGANGLLLGETKEAGIAAGLNMYGIVVVPITENGEEF
jgi:hypothetical protein